MAEFGEAAARLSGVATILLGWRAERFWSATPAELGAVLGALQPEGAAPPTRDAIAKLMEEFPDG